MSALLSIRVARKAFSGQIVLENIRLDIGQGEVVALVGPSGCGKSTLLRIAAGLEREFAGEVHVAGQPIRAPSPAVGLMFQEPRLLPWLTVAENVAFSEDGERGARRRALELLAEVELHDWADALPKQLSGGMAQRVALARGLFRQPAVLLLDEPFSAVDALKRMRLQELLLRVVYRHAVTTLMVTHDVDEAVYLADRVIVFDAAPATVRAEVPVTLERPRSRTDVELAGLRARLLETLQEAATISRGPTSALHCVST